MFDSTSAALLRSAPALSGFDPQGLPAVLTQQYAALASARLSAGADELDGTDVSLGWTLERVADSYELIATMSQDPTTRRPSAFAAATARQILSRREIVGPSLPRSNLERDSVDSGISAAVLFLIAEQYADANEAAGAIRTVSGVQPYETTILSEHIRDLTSGRLDEINTRANRWRRETFYPDLEERTFYALVETICCGIELLASEMLALPQPSSIIGRYEGASAAFEQVISVSRFPAEAASGTTVGMVFSYPGPHHLALLLTAAASSLLSASIMSVPPTSGADVAIWEAWLRSRARKAPYVWPNHREAISKAFYQTGVSAVVVLPTGAGKTTVSSLKIAGVLARGKKVVFLAPTHALVDQLTDDLKAMFPKDVMGAVVSSDYDMLLVGDAQVQDIEVMTPERCLAMLSFAPEAFENVGLMVFDECHLLSPKAGKIRRALDAMLCVLAFQRVAPDADMLFLSAMLQNGEELSKWVQSLTGRDCIPVDLPWKPSRQARGVVVYQQDEVSKAKDAALAIQGAENVRLNDTAGSLRAPAKRALTVLPYALWGLQHNWLEVGKAWFITRKISDRPITLAGKLAPEGIYTTPNANKVAAHIAASAVRNGVKTIVFVNTKNNAVTVAADIAADVKYEIVPNATETAKWAALEVELGGLEHSPIPAPAAAVPHNGAMLKLERDICESLFRRSDGARSIVATPTLAQGLNLPAQLAILAGDKRADADGRQDLQAHELLNAAARAGRAGHLANGLVLLVPDPIVQFDKPDFIEPDAVGKLKSILPEDDHCVRVTDPLEAILDRITIGNQDDPDVRYIVNRFSVLAGSGSGDSDHLFDLKKSMGAFIAAQRGGEAVFEAKAAVFRELVEKASAPGMDVSVALLATQSGLSAELIDNLRRFLQAQLETLPTTISDWLAWAISWLANDDAAREALLGDAAGKVKVCVGAQSTANFSGDHVTLLLPGLLAWISGKPLRDIEIALGGEPDHESSIPKRLCPRARELVVGLVPRNLSFAIGVLSHVLEGLDPFDEHPHIDPSLVETLSTAVRRGFDEPGLIGFAAANPTILSRVQLHLAWKGQVGEFNDRL